VPGVTGKNDETIKLSHLQHYTDSLNTAILYVMFYNGARNSDVIVAEDAARQRGRGSSYNQILK
jgi:hypothetical protein